MSAEHPFNRMPLEDGEELVVKSWNPTFHRSFDFAVAVSDRALYIRRYRFLMPPAWRRFDVSSIRGLTLRPAAFRPWIPIAMTALFATLVIANLSKAINCCQ